MVNKADVGKVKPEEVAVVEKLAGLSFTESDTCPTCTPRPCEPPEPLSASFCVWDQCPYKFAGPHGHEGETGKVVNKEMVSALFGKPRDDDRAALLLEKALAPVGVIRLANRRWTADLMLRESPVLAATITSGLRADVWRELYLKTAERWAELLERLDLAEDATADDIITAAYRQKWNGPLGDLDAVTNRLRRLEASALELRLLRLETSVHDHGPTE